MKPSEALRAFALPFALAAACSPPPFQYPPSPPKIARFSISPDQVAPGGRATLSWRVSGADRVSLLGLVGGERAVQAEETLEIFPEQTLALELKASGPGGDTRARLRVTVVEPLEVTVEALDVLPERVSPGEPVRVSWQTKNALKVRLRLSNGEVLVESAPASGNLTIRPESDVEVELRADGYPQPIVRTRFILVSAEGPVIRSLRVMPRTVTPPEHAALSWTVDRAKHVRIREAGDFGERELMSGPADPPMGTLAIDPNGGTKRLILEASNDAATVEDSTTLYVIPRTGPEIVAFTARPQITGPTGDVVLRWSTRFADTVEIQGAVSGLPYATRNAEGSLIVPIIDSATFRLSAVRGTSAPVTATVAVTVDRARPELIVQADMPAFGIGETVSITWYAPRGQRVEAYSDTGARVYTATGVRGVMRYRVDRSETLRFVATNAHGPTDRYVRLFAAPRPRILELARAAPVARLGRKIEIAWRTENAASGQLASHPASVPVLISGPITIGREIADGKARLDFNRTGTATVTLWATSALTYLVSTNRNITVNLLPAWSGPMESEPNDDQWTANGPYGGAPFNINGSLEVGDVDMFAVAIPRATRIAATTAATTGCNAPIYADIYEERAGYRLGRPAVTIRPTGGCATIDSMLQPAVAGLDPPLIIALFRPQGSTAPPGVPYRLQVTYDLSLCGDGIRDRGEECDDGNLVAGDGCDPHCRVEGLDELEPNDSFERATPIAIGRPNTAFLNDDDTDYFTFPIDETEAGPARILLEAPSSGGCALDAKLTLYRGDRSIVAVDDGHVGCPMMTGPALVLDPGTYFLKVAPGPGYEVSHRGPYQISVVAR